MQTRYDRCRTRTNGRPAACFVEYQVLVLDDPECVVETSWADCDRSGA
jgi:hypothetical protein